MPVNAMTENLGPNKLQRTLTLPFVALYGLGVTAGAGIYVLVSQAIGHGASGYVAQSADWPVTQLLIFIVIATGLWAG